MVRITEKYLFRKLSKTPQIQTRRKGESDREYLNRMTHLYLESQFVDQIAPMTDCASVTVVYLQNNQLQTIHNVDNFPNLSHLYLSNNQISKIENLSRLKNLKKLYLGSNEISVLEGLDELENLTELHVEGQRLPDGETLYLDPRTVKSLGRCLKVLNLSRNNLTTIRGLSGMSALEDLTASDNKLGDVDDVVDTLSTLTSLRRLNLTGNPIASRRKYREALTLASPSLRVLDEKDITPVTRNFVEGLALRKESRTEAAAPPTRPLPKAASELGNRTGHAAARVYPLLRLFRMPRTVSTFSANVSPHYFHQSIRAFRYGASDVRPSPNFK